MRVLRERKGQAVPRRDADMVLAATLAADAGSTVIFTFAVTNPADTPVSIRFRSGQRADVVVYPSNGGEPIWRWSEGRMFVQVTETIAIGPGETREWAFGWADPPAGTFRAVAELAGDVATTAETTVRVAPA